MVPRWLALPCFLAFPTRVELRDVRGDVVAERPMVVGLCEEKQGVAQWLVATTREGAQYALGHVKILVIEENKSLLWLVGTVSSALAGWCVYVLRRLHYERIEGAMSEISLKMKHMEQIAGEQEKDKVPRAISKIEMVTIIGPAVISAFSFGYLAGRSISSYKWHKQLRVTQGLNSNRVYVAVIPEHLFEAQKVASELAPGCKS
ncbi:unnamed protein product [Symbiodinium sp. CCMP2592]|nr:unnamed protein product [Symbiodinium sp. CCMP2592]